MDRFPNTSAPRMTDTPGAIPVLAVSDEIDARIYSETLRERMAEVRLVISCGDLPARYLEFLADALDQPVYYVLGNHAEELTRRGNRGDAYHPLGCVDLGGKVVRDASTGLILAGLPGSPKYCEAEPEQYSEWGMTALIIRMLPRLGWNKVRHGRALDVLISHAPPRDVNDGRDHAHRGFKITRRFLRWFGPRYHLHGHVHRYDRSQPNTTTFLGTEVINVHPYQTLALHIPALGPSSTSETAKNHSPATLPVTERRA